MITLLNIEKIYGKNENQTIALKNINLQINEGDFISIMGSSGCGKSTLLNILGMIDKPTKGDYIFENQKINFNNINSLSEIRNTKISFIFQNFALINDMTVLNNCLLPLKFRKGKKSDKHNLIDKYLSELGILNIKNKLIKELSGGQQQRVAIARALVQDTKIILADEPTGALDEENSIKILEIFKLLNEKYKKTIILVTHDLDVSKYAHTTYIIKDGKFISNSKDFILNE
ncbi:ABC transporter ATP-binding protein [Clostridium chauvoei]|uniref:ABC transporter ATP-binding protein n=2 Tax=Clostridium chauvoei TaxID=46867 RepID=A0ABD4RKH9_9CLOT|nr:ABC transporter ATP-binding protein [Clostridium chauvoei]ATD54183.1 peptide ABC transporter ATP-binding protein [Clostridium chauvoei]ATD58138.1 peptide ABC transporter ATP-binding protein [Clostridium chauvoei]MBX7281842.1 ABC transporter ATP-binding protein [Clostridium chauvoei]MBX7284363.1 ABC transporter ATP-binding protein [Clostridium chauvoei]MBX7286885.1 ABC transporter ATP-binding protein [Clostridium chauvoei]